MVPHVESVVSVTHTPVESQHPIGQLAGVQVSAHWPEAHAWATVHVWHDTPPEPQLVEDSSVWHWPSVPQHPLGHVVALQIVAVSPGASPVPVSPTWPSPPPVSFAC